MRPLRLFALLSCLLAAEASLAQQPPPPVTLDAWLVAPALWQATPGQFPAARELGFRWVSATHDAARAGGNGLRLRDLPVAEVIARFSPGTAQTPAATPGIAAPPAVINAAAGQTQLSGVQVSIYNRGDSGDLDKKTFDALVEHSKAALNALTGVAPLERGIDNASAVPSRGLVWGTPQSRFLLEWSDTPENRVQNIAYRAEFVRLRVTPQPRDQAKSYVDQLRAASALAAGAAHATTVRAADLPARVVKEPDGGERLPNVPMVDQGEKGYCVTAATERVLRYYGVEVDQNELAQVANTSAAMGTSTEAMTTALKKLASRFKVQIFTEYSLNYADFTQQINDYNRVARTAKLPSTDLIDTRGGMLDYDLITHQMKGDLLLEAKTKLNPSRMTRFEHDVQTHIERGIPLLWSVMLGILPEDGLSSRARGGHMRLIVGLNPKTHEVYYTDTWGIGHELKKMPLANAWTITDGLFTLEPG